MAGETKKYMWGGILELIKCTYGLVQDEHYSFKEYFKIMTINELFHEWKSYPYLLYIMKKTRTVIFIIWVYGMLSNGDEPYLLDKLEYTKKNMWLEKWLEKFVGHTMQCEPSKTTPNISQPDLVSKFSQDFNGYVKEIINFNILIYHTKAMIKNKKWEPTLPTSYRKDTRMAQDHSHY